MNKAICVITHGSVSGHVKFEQTTSGVRVDVELQNVFPANANHGIHVHKYGNLLDGCTSTCEHFDVAPFNRHGGRLSMQRHVGDLGNIYSDNNGLVNTSFVDNIISLSGETNIIGRAIVIHEKEDDCGMGKHEESLKTGNSGKRIGCGVIGIA